MVVPCGFGVGDFVAVGTLAWNVYKSCKAAPSSFSNISNEVLSLHAVLKEADETIFRSPLPSEKQARLKIIGDGCQCALDDLQALVNKYEDLGGQSKRTWDRIKWGAEDTFEIRSRLISNTTMLTAFISISQISVEQKLDKLITDFQKGKRAPSAVSLQTVASLNSDDKEAWKTIRKELEDIGISVTAFHANKDFIFEWFSKAVDTGAFQEQVVSNPSGSVHSLDVLSSTSSLSSLGVKELNKKTVMRDTRPPEASKAKTKHTRRYTVRQAAQASNGNGTGAGPHTPVIPTKVSRVAALIASLSLPKTRLYNAAELSDLDKIKKILSNPATSRLIDKPTLNEALYRATQTTSKEACALLIDAGAKINRDSSLWGGRPLTEAVRSQNRDIVAFLLDRGADVNYQSRDEGANYQNEVTYKYSSALETAIALDDEAMVTLLVQKGAYVNGRRHYRRPLTMAVCKGNRNLVAFLLDKGADVNYQSCDTGRYTNALRAAITRDDEAMIAFLTQRGADLNIVQEYTLSRVEYPTAIHQASVESSGSVVELLINLGADFDVSQKGWGTPLMLAVYKDCISTAQVLIRKGANIHKVPRDLKPYDKSFSSIIHIAIEVSSSDLVKLLLWNGVMTDWHKAYQIAKRVKEWEAPRSSDARQIYKLIKEQKERSAVQA